MPISTSRKQHLNVNSSQMEIDQTRSNGLTAPINEDFTGKLQEAQHQLEILQQQQAEVERQRIELQDLNKSKEEFINGQVELQEKLTSSVTAMDREIFTTRQELEELEQARVCFVDHLEKVNTLNPDSEDNDTLRQELTRAISVIDLAEDEYEQVVDHFSGGRSASVFSIQSAKTKRSVTSNQTVSEFTTTFRNGLAFNLPILILGGIGLIAFLAK